MTSGASIDPCRGIARGLGLHCTFATWGSSHPLGVVGLYSAVWGVPAGNSWAASQELLLPVFVPAVGPRESTGTMRYRCSYWRSGPEPTGSSAAPAPAVERR